VTTARISGSKLIATGAYLTFWPALILVLGGDRRWVEGWIFGLWFVAMCTTTIAWLYRKDPALLAERYRRPGSGGQSARDKIVVYLLALGFTAWIVFMPLDGRRFHWSPPLPLGAGIAGGALLLLAWLLLFRAFTDNTFLSPLVRIQEERHHQVVSTGVYGVVRHPMYLGAVLMFLGGPLLLGSLGGLAIAVALTLLLVARIRDEERLLARDLPGYDDYRRRVRFRLIPLVW
jgi:protein-S-isoprenylcysteine O-methyltransferase Ste14